MKKFFLLGFILLIAVTLALAQERGAKKKRPLPQDYGKVVMNSFSEKHKMAPVVFDHWLHRAKFTCGLCHVDLAFGMKAGTSGVRAADNMNGLYCGTCHNGKMVVNDKRVFKSCAKETTAENMKTCDRCHAFGKEVKREYNFAEFTAKLPRERFGNGIDWEKAEQEGLIKPSDYIEGISIKKKSMPVQKDFSLEPKVAGLPEIVFSHQKHTLWNGCAVCHPDIFVGVKKGTTKYSMTEIFEGKYCGACHGTVAFPNIDCQRCHSKPVS